MKEVTKNPIKGTLRLKNPILINGNEITEVTYDSNEIDGILFATAESRRKAAAGRKDISIAPAAEFDFSLHLYLGFAAIVAVNPSYDFSDLERIKGHDVVEVMTIGRNFMLASGEKTQTATTPASLQRLRQSLPHQHVRPRKKASNRFYR